MITTNEKNNNGLSADIVIIGGGGAGMASAISAAHEGVKNIIVLEKVTAPGGNTAISHGLFAVNSAAQKRLGIKLSIDDVFQDRMAYSNWNVNPRLVRSALNRSAEIVDWLEKKGMSFDNIVNFLPEDEGPKVFHKIGAPGASPEEGAIGETLSKILSDECKKMGVQMVCNAPAKKNTDR